MLTKAEFQGKLKMFGFKCSEVCDKWNKVSHSCNVFRLGDKKKPKDCPYLLKLYLDKNLYCPECHKAVRLTDILADGTCRHCQYKASPIHYLGGSI